MLFARSARHVPNPRPLRPTVARFVCRLIGCLVFAAVLFPSGGVGLAAPDTAYVSVRDPGLAVANLAQQYVGSPYRWGGLSPAGFDCSGFVKFVYAQFGIDLPHDESGQLNSGPRVDADSLAPGDILVFADTYRAGLSHVGIYIGDGRFVHAADEAHGVLVSNLWDSYWSSRFVGASRVLG